MDKDGRDVHQLYYLGIIDMLQTYNVQKQMEHNLKMAKGQDAAGISSTDPARYAERFLAFMYTKLVAES